MKICFLSILLLTNISILAQDSFIENVVVPLQKNPILFEKVFIHTNKTTYFLDEVIWFKAYVGDANNNPALMTTKLHVNLLKIDGSMIFSKNILIQKGTGIGQFILNAAVKPGKYYLQAYTNYMRNFGENNYFLQEINIIDGAVTNNNQKRRDHQFQVLPEGGTLLEGTQNIMGINALSQREDLNFSGRIINSRNKEVASFKSKHLGMAKSSFFYKPGEMYTALIKVKDTLIKIPVPKAKKEGIIFHFNNLDTDTLKVQLKTNKRTLNNFEESKYSLLYHQRNKVIGSLKFSELDSLSALIESPKRIFYDGINTATFFKDNQPVAQHKFYTEYSDQKIELSLRLINVTADSLTYKLRLQNRNGPIKATLSVSVLSGDVQDFKKSKSIKSAFLISPYIQSSRTDLSNLLFKNNVDGKKYRDLFLLNQEWPSYSLQEMIKKLNPRSKLNFELGIELKGEIEPPLYSDKLALISNKNTLIDTLSLNGNKKFVFEKLLLYKGDTVKVAFLDNEGTAIKPKGIHFDSIKRETHPDIDTSYSNLSKKGNKARAESGGNLNISDAIELDEVVLTGKKRSDSYHRRKELIEKYRPLVWDIGKYHEIALPETYKYFYDDLMSFLRFYENVKLVSFQGREYYLELPGKKEALLYIDGELVKSYELPGVFIDMNNIENIMVQSIKGNRIFQVFTNEDYNNNSIELATEYVIENGYDRSLKYHPPQHDYDEKGENRLIEVAWKPEIMTDKNGEAFFIISNKQYSERLLFSIEGFSEGGLLISKNLVE